MAYQRLSSAPSRKSTSRGAAGVAGAAVLAGGWFACCAGLLGIEEASCDPEFDARCAATSVGMLTPGGTGGAAPPGNAAGTGGGADAAGSGGSAGVAGSAFAGAGGASPTDEIVEPSLCERYCDTIMSACTGDYEQYASPMACVAVCNLLEPGTPGGFGANTVECRLARADLARATGEPASYCHTAGPGGGGVCGTDCEGFCTIMADMCTLMGTYDDCLPLCEEVPNLSGGAPNDVVNYSTAVQGGDSVQCRLYHVTAATLDSRTHCVHAAGLALCVPSTVF